MGKRLDPYFKCDWNPSLILSQNFFSHLGRIPSLTGRGCRRVPCRLRWLARLRPGPALRRAHLARSYPPHTAYPLSLEVDPGSTASSNDNKPYAWEAGARAISEHLIRRGIDAAVRRALADFYAVDYRLPEPPPKVSIIVPTTAELRLIKPCLTTLVPENLPTQITRCWWRSTRSITRCASGANSWRRWAVRRALRAARLSRPAVQLLVGKQLGGIRGDRGRFSV